MIKCDICRQDGIVTGFHITGHAGAGEYGQDIVCAGVSAIVLTALGSLQEMFNIEDFDGVDSDDEGGDVSFRLPRKFWQSEPDDAVQDEASQMALRNHDDQIRVAAILDAMVIGLKQIEMQYGDYVVVTERDTEREV